MRSASNASNPRLPRIAFKMATGSGKTVVMAMLIAWQALNRLADPRAPRFSDTFLIIAPGITIRDRLRVLLPNDPQHYCRQRFPGRDAESLTDEDLLREMMNTVGKAGKLGEHVKCVVSVSMLTKGWDANTVTHILGVRALESRIACEIALPRLQGHRYDAPCEKLTASSTEDSLLSLSTADVPTETEMFPIVGTTENHCLEGMDEVRRYVKNHHLGFNIRCVFNGEQKNYNPDFIACVDDGRGDGDLLNLIIEVTGQKKKDKYGLTMDPLVGIL